MESLVVFILIFERLRMTNLMCSAWLQSLSDHLSQPKCVKLKFVSFGVNMDRLRAAGAQLYNCGFVWRSS